MRIRKNTSTFLVRHSVFFRSYIFKQDHQLIQKQRLSSVWFNSKYGVVFNGGPQFYKWITWHTEITLKFSGVHFRMISIILLFFDKQTSFMRKSQYVQLVRYRCWPREYRYFNKLLSIIRNIILYNGNKVMLQYWRAKNVNNCNCLIIFFAHSYCILPLEDHQQWRCYLLR